MDGVNVDLPAPFPRPGSSPELRLLPLALAAVWASTVLSVEVTSPRLDDSLWRFGATDLWVNVLLYLPLGIALRGRGIVFAGMIGATLSMGVELTQLFYPDRYTAATDVAANAAGVVVGCAASRRFGRRNAWGLDPIALSPTLILLAAVGIVLAIGALARPGRASDFSNWDPECRLIVADELTRNRPWEGSIESLAVFDDCLARTEIEGLSRVGWGPVAADLVRSRGPLVVMQPPADLDSVRGIPLLNAVEHAAFFNALAARGELTVLVWFRTALENQAGPARIAGYSKSNWAQNFSLGQEGREVNFRLRTPTTSPGGYNPQTRTRPILARDEETLVAATYDGRNVRVFVNGSQEARLNLRAQGRISPFLSDNGLPVAAALLGALMGIACVAFERPPRVSLARACGHCAIGGLLGGLAFVVAGGADALPEFRAWIPLVSCWSGAVTGCSRVWGATWGGSGADAPPGAPR
jgi:hypothetical protein